MMEEYLFEKIAETDRAILVSDGDVECWLPKSQIEIPEDCEDAEKGDMITIYIPDWLAKENELI